MKSNPSVILPLIRRVMPNIIANDILGVSPMIAPTGKIFTMKAEWENNSSLILTKKHFRHFLRVYNRKKYFTERDMTSLGYQSIYVKYQNVKNARDWCEDHLKSGSYVCWFNKFWFAYDTDFTLFIMRWS